MSSVRLERHGLPAGRLDEQAAPGASVSDELRALDAPEAARDVAAAEQQALAAAARRDPDWAELQSLAERSGLRLRLPEEPPEIDWAAALARAPAVAIPASARDYHDDLVTAVNSLALDMLELPGSEYLAADEIEPWALATAVELLPRHALEIRELNPRLRPTDDLWRDAERPAALRGSGPARPGEPRPLSMGTDIFLDPATHLMLLLRRSRQPQTAEAGSGGGGGRQEGGAAGGAAQPGAGPRPGPAREAPPATLTTAGQLQSDAAGGRIAERGELIAPRHTGLPGLRLADIPLTLQQPNTMGLRAALTLAACAAKATARLAVSGSQIDIASYVQWVLRQSYLNQLEDLVYQHKRVAHLNDLRDALRDELNRARRALNGWAAEDGAAGGAGSARLDLGSVSKVVNAQALHGSGDYNAIGRQAESFGGDLRAYGANLSVEEQHKLLEHFSRQPLVIDCRCYETDMHNDTYERSYAFVPGAGETLSQFLDRASALAGRAFQAYVVGEEDSLFGASASAAEIAGAVGAGVAGAGAGAAGFTGAAAGAAFVAGAALNTGSVLGAAAGGAAFAGAALASSVVFLGAVGAGVAGLAIGAYAISSAPAKGISIQDLSFSATVPGYLSGAAAGGDASRVQPGDLPARIGLKLDHGGSEDYGRFAAHGTQLGLQLQQYVDNLTPDQQAALWERIRRDGGLAFSGTVFETDGYDNSYDRQGVRVGLGQARDLRSYLLQAAEQFAADFGTYVDQEEGDINVRDLDLWTELPTFVALPAAEASAGQDQPLKGKDNSPIGMTELEIGGGPVPELTDSEVAITTREQLTSYIKHLEERLNGVGDDAQLANVDLQNALQKQQQLIQMMSNIAKLLHETAVAVIRKLS